MSRLKRIPGIVCRKRHGTVMGLAGDPDVYGVYQGRHFEIELKSPGEKPTKLQDIRREEWAKAGAITGVAQSLAEVLRILGIEE